MAGIEIEEKDAEAKPKPPSPGPKTSPPRSPPSATSHLQRPAETWTLDRTAKSFKGAKRTQVQSVLDSLAALGLLIAFGTNNDRKWGLVG